MNKTIVMILAAVVVIGAGAGVYYFVNNNFNADNGESANLGEKSGGEGATPAGTQNSDGKMTTDLCFTVGAYVNLGMQAVSQGNQTRMSQIDERVQELQRQYGFDAASGEFSDFCNTAIGNDLQKVYTRMAELERTL